MNRLNRVNRLLFLSLFLVVVCTLAASTATCIFDDKKDDSEVHVIRLDDPGNEGSSEAGIIEIHIPSENRRKRETIPKGTEKPCKKDGECLPGKKCDLKTSKCRSSASDKKSTAEPAEPKDEKM